jgi:APA family basic amino acid/polyamine antiporter
MAITFVAIVSAAAVAIGFSEYMVSFFPQLDSVLTAISLVAALSAVNFVGIRESVLDEYSIHSELAGLGIVVLAAVFLGSFDANYYEVPPDASGSLSLSTGATLGAAELAFFAYFAFENLANIAQETKNAPRTIPRALIISIAATTGIYIIISLSAMSLVGWEQLSSTDAPLALATERAFGAPDAVLLSAIALFATSNTVLI